MKFVLCVAVTVVAVVVMATLDAAPVVTDGFCTTGGSDLFRNVVLEKMAALGDCTYDELAAMHNISDGATCENVVHTLFGSTCSTIDSIPGTCGTSSRKKRYLAFSDFAWNKTTVTYTHFQDGDSVPYENGNPKWSLDELNTRIDNAAALYNTANVNIQLEAAADPSSADIQISFEENDHGDGALFSSASVYGHAFIPEHPGKAEYSGDIHLNLDSAWTYIIYFENVLVHELGHSLGLLHSAEPGSVMVADYNVAQTNTELGADDIAGLLALYGEAENVELVTVGTEVNESPFNARESASSANTNTRG